MKAGTLAVIVGGAVGLLLGQAHAPGWFILLLAVVLLYIVRERSA